MDYQFTKDILGHPCAKFSMGHEAIGRWLTDELGDNLQRVQALINTVEQVEQSIIGFREIIGLELVLHLSISGIEIEPVESDVEPDEMMIENGELYQSESFSECGLQDFKQALLSWQEYVS